jgi:YD repeat-containing protein
MKLLIPIFLIWTLLQTVVLGQDKQQEAKFFKDRTKIKNSKIIEIKKSVAHETCSKDGSTLAVKYNFDHSGNLILQSEYQQNSLRRTIAYTRNNKGDYTAKVYTLFDSSGNLSSKEPWTLQFNNLGQRVKETWTKDGKPVRINILSYDDKGNMIEQITDSKHKWVLKYDEAGQIVETEDWELINDSMQCTGKMTYLYENGRLIKDTGTVPSENRIWREFVYKYGDSGNLIEVDQKLWMRYGNQPRKLESENSRIVYVNDKNGNVVREELYSYGSLTPWTCYFYEYVYD